MNLTEFAASFSLELSQLFHIQTQVFQPAFFCELVTKSSRTEAMHRAIPSEENEYCREQANAGFEPLREAIEFAVTLPENVSVIIYGFWLWLEGETYLCKNRIKSFTSPDEIRFRWSKHKTS